MNYNKVLLLILDGFGINSSDKGNAIAAAHIPYYDSFLAKYPHNQLIACGEDVGLPPGVMGNSEVGHLNIGAGRIVMQLNCRIDKSIETKEFQKNPAINSAIDHALDNKSNLHLIGLLSTGNVHSNMIHLYPILEMAKVKKLKQVYIHAIMDGRDTLPHSGKDFLAEVETKIKEIGIGKIATISGRYYAMDRDNNWQRVKLAYDALVNGAGNKFTASHQAVKSSYDENVTDEFVIPSIITQNDEPLTKISENDSIIFFNYRADRARELTSSLIIPDFDQFPTKKFHNLKFVSFSEYDENFQPFLQVAFPKQDLPDTLAQVISKHNLKQLHLAETEKYAHVTFFFNGGEEIAYPHEDRILVPSPKVKTYDLQPEMSAYIVKEKLVQTLQENNYHFVVTNFANPDMVGHTGDFQATIKAVETIDNCLKEVIPAAIDNGYNIILIADHGNADEMLDANGNILTQHSTNPVPVVIALQNNGYTVNAGRLADIAPTILNIMNIPIPSVMTGKILINYTQK
jgi:2,3-bisphosphoglycerate-independent phosphoglycerate mutase